MPKPSLERVKKLAEQLPSQERGQLWEHLASLPDSGIMSTQLPKPLESVRKQKEAQEAGLLQTTTFRFEWKIADDGEAIFSLDGVEIFRVGFNAENCANVLFKKIKIDKPFLRIQPEKEQEYFTRVREELVKQGEKAEVTDEQIRGLFQPALLELCKQLVKRSLEDATEHTKNNLPAIVNTTFQKVVQAIFFSGTNTLRDNIEQPETKYSAKDVIDAVFGPDIELIKMLAGVTPGGARRRKSKFAWDTEKARRMYETVEALPRYGTDNKPMWEYARDLLRDNDYDYETIQFLKNRPMFADVPEDLLKEAARVWRRYDENWDSLPPENSPFAFTLRHACHKLDFPYTTYNTARTNYYKGKKASEGKS